MKREAFQKNILAMCMGVMGTQAFALEYDLGAGQNNWTDQTINEPLVLTGQLTQSVTVRNSRGVTISRSQINGSLLNQADILLNANGLSVSGLVLDWDTGPGARASQIQGDVIQSGKISLLDASSTEGFEIGQTVVKGSVVNAGAIVIKSSVGGVSGINEGIYVHGAQIGGDLANTGSIDVSGSNAAGIIIDRSYDVPTTIGGKLLNSGTIRVTGDLALGFEMEAPSSDLRIENSGLISTVGKRAETISLYDGSIDYLLNTGTLESKGESASAITLNGVHFAQHSPSGERGIINRGSIVADGVAIWVSNDQTQVDAFEINQQAGEIRSNTGTAIDAAHLATLNWTGGKIVGDVLNVNAVSIAGQADFIGKRIVSPVSINAGSLNLSSAGSTITGDLNVAGGAGIDMRLTDSVMPTTAYLNVEGAAIFAQASKVTLSAAPGDFTAVPTGTEYTLVNATRLQNNGLSVASQSSLLDVLSYSTDAQTVKAVVGLKSNQQVEQELGAAGAEKPVMDVINTVKNDVLSQLDQNDPVFLALANASTPQALAAVGEQLKPEVSRGALDVALSGQTLINSAIFGRLAAQRPVQETALRHAVWIQSLNSDMDQDGRRGDTGYSANSSGTAVGADAKVNPNATIGVAYSYLNANIQSARGNKADAQGSTLSLYGNWALQRGFVDGSLSYGRSENGSKRYIAGSRATGDYDSHLLALSILGGYRFNLSEQVLIEPRMAARYSSVRMNGFNEKGSSVALSTSSQRYEVGELGAGLRLAGNLPFMNGTLQPEATLMTYRDMMGDRVAQTSSFVLGGDAFKVAGASVSRDSVEASVGVSYQLSAFGFGASYSRQTRSGFDADLMKLSTHYVF